MGTFLCCLLCRATLERMPLGGDELLRVRVLCMLESAMQSQSYGGHGYPCPSCQNPSLKGRVFKADLEMTSATHKMDPLGRHPFCFPHSLLPESLLKLIFGSPNGTGPSCCQGWLRIHLDLVPVLQGPADPYCWKDECVWSLLPEMGQPCRLWRQRLGCEARVRKYPP